MSQLKKLVKDISIYGVSEFLNRSVQILFLPIIFAYLNTSEFGTLDLFLTTKNIIAVIFGWGMITAVQRFGGIKSEDNYTLEEVITCSFLVVFIISIITGLILFGVYIFTINYEIRSFVLVLGISIFYAFRSIILGVLRLQHRAKEFLIVTLINVVIYLFGTFLLINFTKLSYVAFLVAGFIGISISFLFGLYTIRKSLKIHFRKKLFKSIFRFGASLLSTSLIVIFVASSNRYSLSLFGNSLEEVGILGMSNRLSLFVGALLVAPFTLAWLPFVNENHTKENFHELVSIIFKAVVLIGILLTTLLIVFGYPILTYLGKSSYVNSMLITPFFCFSFIFQAGYYIFSSSFYINEQNQLYVKSSLFVFIINITMLALIIPVTNFITVSIVTMSTYFAQMLFAYYYSNSIFKLDKPDIFKILFFLVISIISISVIVFSYENALKIGWVISVSISMCLIIFSTVYFLFNKEFQFKKLIVGIFN